MNITVHKHLPDMKVYVYKTKTYICPFFVKVEFTYAFFSFLFGNNLKLTKVAKTGQRIFVLNYRKTNC